MTKRDPFWLKEAQVTPIEPHPPADMRGKPRVEDHDVIGRGVRDGAKAADKAVFHL